MMVHILDKLKKNLPCSGHFANTKGFGRSLILPYSPLFIVPSAMCPKKGAMLICISNMSSNELLSKKYLTPNILSKELIK